MSNSHSSVHSSNTRLERRGILFTKLYLILLVGGIPMLGALGAIDLKQLSLNELGDFLAGAFGPLALFWLVLGFFQQGHELRNSVEALQLQAEELKRSVEQQQAMVGITEKQLNLDIEVRSDQIRSSTSRELPLIQISSNGAMTSGRKSIYGYKVTNIGAAASDIEFSFGPEGKFIMVPSRCDFLANQGKFEFELRSDDGADSEQLERSSLTAKMQNIRSQSRKQVFDMSSGQPKLISVEPENN